MSVNADYCAVTNIGLAWAAWKTAGVRLARIPVPVISVQPGAPFSTVANMGGIQRSLSRLTFLRNRRVRFPPGKHQPGCSFMLSFVVSAALTMTIACAATAQEFPSKVVRLVVAFPPGGGNDVVARTLSPALSRALGQSVMVENRPGANTIIGMTLVARAPADGHTILLGGIALVAALRSNLPFDPLKDFAAVAGIGINRYVLSVHPSLPAKSIKELIALARARPGELAYATNGYGQFQHLSGELLKVRARIDMKLVVFQGGAPSTIAVLGGHAGVLISTIASMVEHIPAGKLRVLAVTSRERSELLKDVPTMMESGVPEFDISSLLGVSAPAAAPKAAIDRLSAEIIRAAQLPEVKARLILNGYEGAPIGAGEYDAYTLAKIQEIKKIASDAKIKLD
jgi:tripartite-type tricarboxylate transporter receptor subunit TctC